MEDKFSVQFIHRWMGTVLTMGLLLLGWKAFIEVGYYRALQTRRMKWVIGLVSVQFLLGVSTILLIVGIRYPYLSFINLSLCLYLQLSLDDSLTQSEKYITHFQLISPTNLCLRVLECVIRISI